MNKEFWKGRRVFVTGHTGYKGSWLAYWLCKMGAVVTGYALPPSENSFYNKLFFHDLNDIQGDIRNKELLSYALRLAEPEVIVHLAGYSNIYKAIDNPSEAFDVNVMGTVNLMESIRKIHSMRALVCVTSDKVYYGLCTTNGFKENENLLGAIDPYSASKVSQEVITESYKNTYLKDLGVATARASNVLGPGDLIGDRLIPHMISCFSKGEVVQLRNPLSVRPWQNMLDCLDGYLTLAEKLYENSNEYSGAWNIGPSVDGMQTVEWIAKKAAAYWGDNAAYQIVKTNNNIPEKDILCLDISKAATMLGWSPRWELQDTLKEIIDFEKKRNDGVDLNILYDGLINRHMNRAIRNE